MLVPQFIQEKTMPVDDRFYDCIPTYCPDCGMPMEMNETLTQLRCSNPKCYSKVVQRLVAMANQLGVKDLGEAKAKKFVEKYKVTNPLLIYALEPDAGEILGDGISIEVSKKISDQFQNKNKFTLPEYVKIANIPFIQSSALSVFKGFDNLIDAYKEIEDGGVDYIRERLSIKESDTEISVRALKIYESLMTFKDDLIQGLEFVHIIPTNVYGMVNKKAVCSDEVGAPFKTKAEFYATCNNQYPNVHIDFASAVTKDIDYLIWAGADGSPARYTNKVKKTEAYNKKYDENVASGKVKEGEHRIPIMTAKQFLIEMRRLAGDNSELA